MSSFEYLASGQPGLQSIDGLPLHPHSLQLSGLPERMGHTTLNSGLITWVGLAIWFEPLDFNSQHCLDLDPQDTLKGYRLMNKLPPRVPALNDDPKYQA